ncbi:MAG TPA: rod shape-determining protein MreC [Hyphomonadaceae bacterium]|nr:rod shape-determining protein MreC [Hyphomonadaceae bacterium]
MAWYGRRRSGEPRVGARAVVVGLGLAMVGALAIQTSSTVRDGIDISRRSMDGVTANLASFTSGIASWSIGFGRSKEDQDKIAALEAQIRDLQRWKDLAETMTLRMERYEKLLDLVGETQGQSVTARIVAEENGPFAASRIANAGSSNGVREGFAAVNENGLVGRVIRVGEYTSRILLVTDFSSRIPVMGSQSGDRALMVGDSVSGARLVEPETPDKIVPGEMWVTSGDDGKMPLGIRVGRARREKDGEWHIDLTMTSGPVDFVRLSPPPDFAAPEVAPSLTDNGAQPNSDKSLMSSAAPASPQASPAPGAPKPAAPKPAAPKPAAPKPAAQPAQPATPASGQGTGGQAQGQVQGRGQ